MTRATRTLWLLTAIVGTAAAARAHPVPNQAHVRTVDVSLRPNELAVYYRLEVDQLTALRELLDQDEHRGLTKPQEFYDAYLRFLAPLLADQFVASLDGKPLSFRRVEQRAEVTDH